MNHRRTYPKIQISSPSSKFWATKAYASLILPAAEMLQSTILLEENQACLVLTDTCTKCTCAKRASR